MKQALTAALLLSLISECKPSSFHGLMHSNVSIPFTTPMNTEEVLCKFKGNKVFEWEKGNVTYFGSFNGRTALIGNEILIQKLQLNDSGIYELSFISTEGKLRTDGFNLSVHVPLLKPTINCTANDSIIQLYCHSEDHGPLVTIKWKHQNNIVQQDENIYLSVENKSLIILNSEEYLGEYTCLMKQPENQVQSEPINVQSCSKRRYDRLHVFVPVIVIIIILLIAGGWLYYKKGIVKNEYKAPCKENPKHESLQDDEETKLSPSEDREETKPPPSEDREETKPPPSEDGEEIKLHPSDEL